MGGVCHSRILIWHKAGAAAVVSGCPSLFVHAPASWHFRVMNSPLPPSPTPLISATWIIDVFWDLQKSIWCTDPRRGMLKAGLDLRYRMVSLHPPAIAGQPSPPPPSPVLPLAPHTGAGGGGGVKRGGGDGGHCWRWEQMAGRVTSVARLSGPIIPPDGPPALLPFPPPGRPGLPRQRQPAGMQGCPGRERAVLGPHLVPLLLYCPVRRELDLCIVARSWPGWRLPFGEGCRG